MHRSLLHWLVLMCGQLSLNMNILQYAREVYTVECTLSTKFDCTRFLLSELRMPHTIDKTAGHMTTNNLFDYFTTTFTQHWALKTQMNTHLRTGREGRCLGSS